MAAGRPEGDQDAPVNPLAHRGRVDLQQPADVVGGVERCPSCGHRPARATHSDHLCLEAREQGRSIFRRFQAGPARSRCTKPTSGWCPEGPADGHHLTQRASNIAGVSEHGPSQGAVSGFSCTSVKSASTPAATAARASTGTSSRSPPEAVPCRGGQLHRMRGVEAHRQAGAAHLGAARACPPPGCGSRSVAPRSVTRTLGLPASMAFRAACTHVQRARRTGPS